MIWDGLCVVEFCHRGNIAISPLRSIMEWLIIIDGKTSYGRRTIDLPIKIRAIDRPVP